MPKNYECTFFDEFKRQHLIHWNDVFHLSECHWTPEEYIVYYELVPKSDSFPYTEPLMFINFKRMSKIFFIGDNKKQYHINTKQSTYWSAGDENCSKKYISFRLHEMAAVGEEILNPYKLPLKRVLRQHLQLVHREPIFEIWVSSLSEFTFVSDTLSFYYISINKGVYVNHSGFGHILVFDLEPLEPSLVEDGDQHVTFLVNVVNHYSKELEDVPYILENKKEYKYRLQEPNL